MVDDERQHLVADPSLDRVGDVSEQPLLLVARVGHVEDARSFFFDEIGLEPVGRERLGEIAAEARAQQFDVDGDGHPARPYPG